MFISIRSFRVPAPTCVSLTKHLLLHKARQGINKKESVWKMFPAWPQSLTLKKSQQVASRNVWVGWTCVVFLSPFLHVLFLNSFIFLKKVLFILFLSVWVFSLHVYMCTTYVYSALRIKRGYLKLELRMVVCYLPRGSSARTTNTLLANEPSLSTTPWAQPSLQPHEFLNVVLQTSPFPPT